VPPYRAYWVSSLPLCACCFQLRFTAFLATLAPGFLRFRVHPLMTLFPLRSTFLSSPALRPRALSSFPGVTLFLHRDISSESPLTAASQAAYVPPTVFPTLLTVYSSQNLAGLFHPSTTSEILSSGVFPDSQPVWLITNPYPHVVCDPLLRLSCPNRTRSSRPTPRS
jgi:hypothetical protein